MNPWSMRTALSIRLALATRSRVRRFRSHCPGAGTILARSHSVSIPNSLAGRGTAFTAPRHDNRRTWLYRIQPSVVGSHATLEFSIFFGNCDPSTFQLDPNPMRWKPMPLEEGDTKNFVTGMKTLMASGSPLTKDGLAISMYAF